MSTPERGRHGENVDVVAHLHLVEIAAAGVAVDEALEFGALQARVERVADLVRREEDAAEAVDGDRVGQLEAVLLHRLPDFVGGQFGRLGRVEQTADGRAWTQQLLPVGGVGKTWIEEKGVGVEYEAVVVDPGHAGGDHLDADARERAALGEMDFRRVGEDEFELGAGLRGQKARHQGEGVGVLGPEAENLAVGADPEVVGLHGLTAGPEVAKGRRLQ